MQIKSTDTIAGQPIFKIRKLCRYTAGKAWEKEWLLQLIISIIEVDSTTSKHIFNSLVEQGFFEQAKEGKRQEWVNTIKGNSLSMASAAKPILRKTAEKILEDFLKRVKEVNENNYYLFYVEKVIVFGSILGSNEKLGDIDIAIELVPKEKDSGKHMEFIKQRAYDAVEHGRYFPNFLDQLLWARTEVKMFLKSRSRSISLHETNDPILKQIEYKVIYER